MFGRPVSWTTTALLVSIALPAAAQLPPDAQLDVAEEHITTRLEPNNPHRVWIVDPVFPHLIAAKAYIIEANEGKVSGMVNAGYVPNILIPHDKVG